MKNYEQVIQTLIETNEKLLNNEVSLEVAKQVAQNTQTIINGARLVLDVMKFQDKKENNFFLPAPEDDIDKILAEVKANQSKTIDLSSRV